MKTKQKNTQEPKRDKQKSMQKLLHSVGAILEKDGYKALKAHRIAAHAKLDKKLIYNYYGSLSGLIDAYLKENDFWKRTELITEQSPLTDLPAETVIEILKGQFTFLEHSPEMQHIILWELSEKNPLLQDILGERERFGEQLFKLSDKYFKGSSVNFRAVNALLVSAIYYITLHSRYHNNTICGIDATAKKGREQIFKAIEQIIRWCYREAEGSRNA
ncbi:TetR/AcrR family transcriptional regulator [Niabella sp. CC-SYL272]|uniref:TetR/AcrR family transcriptional regulator n=1 Tax=Niabella agricola TaxID=2891571 RepID=UPI001F46EA4C|nr:TetR/AcrR family transcriptional regulator [Niabella agricola]MCF3108979.1 TetR/AcrR family transcriptional regulator [Niabella agricola]